MSRDLPVVMCARAGSLDGMLRRDRPSLRGAAAWTLGHKVVSEQMLSMGECAVNLLGGVIRGEDGDGGPAVSSFTVDVLQEVPAQSTRWRQRNRSYLRLVTTKRHHPAEMIFRSTLVRRVSPSDVGRVPIHSGPTARRRM
jgi:hypothetical protein